MTNPGPKKSGGLLTRLLTSLVLIPTSLALLWIPGLGAGWTLFVAAIVAAGTAEFYALARARGIQPEARVGIVAGTAVALSAGFPLGVSPEMALYASCAAICAINVLRGHGSVAAMSASVFGVVYVGWFGSHIVRLHEIPGTGRGLVLVLFVAVVLTDAAAYFVGKFLGSHKMAPVISPNKTWEGAFGGFAFALAGMAVLFFLRSRQGWESLPDWTMTRYVAAGALLSVASQIGDLAKSGLKRDAGVKDSGWIFPGHGGALDRCDGFLFAAPVMYYISIL